MKYFTLIFLSVSLFVAGTSSGQSYKLFDTTAYLDIANLRAPHQVHGDMWRDLSGSAAGGVEFPKSSGKYISGASALWMSGYNAGGVLLTAAQDYRASGTDYWPGPIDLSAGTPGQAYVSSQKWAKIWKINSSQIDSFLMITAHTAGNTPAAILEWPARGNQNARGAGGASLTINEHMAPFVDVNGDGIYTPLAGDYPKMKGSQMLWWIINDATIPHTVTTTNYFGMDIRMSAYAYKLGTAADNVIFYEYEITNRSSETYSDYRLGVMTDFDIRLYNDDYTGFDSARRVGIVYQGGVTPAGPEPAAGLAWMELPGDSYNSYAPLGSYTTYVNGFSDFGVPRTASEFDRLLRSRNRVGQPYVHGSRYGPGSASLQCDSPTSSGDKRFVIASNSMTFSPGQTKKFGTALVVADSTGACPTMSFANLYRTTDTAYKIYWNPFRTTPLPATTSVSTTNMPSLRMFPNPVNDVLHVDSDDPDRSSVQVFDMTGRALQLPLSLHATGFDIYTTSLAPGIYTISCRTIRGMSTGMFVRQ